MSDYQESRASNQSISTLYLTKDLEYIYRQLICETKGHDRNPGKENLRCEHVEIWEIDVME